MLSDRKNFLSLHLGWCVTVTLLTLAAIAWYALEYLRIGRLPGGSSLVGLSLGIVGALIIVFEMLLAFRKTRYFRTSRWLGNAKLWMKAHIWLGLLVLPLAIMHSGFQFGGPLATALGVVFLFVIASGIYGLVMQNILPRMLLDAVPNETIYSQIDEVSSQLAADAWRLAGLYGGVELPADRREKREAARDEQVQHAAVYGAPRRVGTIVERSPHPERDLPRGTFKPEVMHTLRSALIEDIEPFLLTGKSPGNRLRSQQRIGWYFEELRRRIDQPEAHVAVTAIEGMCQRRRQFNLQKVLHFWLHNWILIHLPLSVLLIVLLVGHIWFALRFN